MQLDELQEECETFLQARFDRYYDTLDPHLNFIETHKLIETKKNMLYAYDFLDEFYQQLRSLHVQFPSDTCNKLHMTLKHLYKTLTVFNEEEANSYQQLFEYNFVNESPVLSNYKLQLKRAKEQHFQPKLLLQLQNNLEKLTLLYRAIFYDLFLEFRQDIRYSLKWILNIYLLYFDTILWEDALHSPILKRHFESLNLKTYSTKHLLLQELSRTNDATIRYAYLQKALKAYK